MKSTWLLIAFCLSGCATLSSDRNVLLPGALARLPSETQQAVVVNSRRVPEASVTGWEVRDGRWRQVFSPMRATIGRKGFAPIHKKREGDGRTPSGIYPIGTAFGYAPDFPTGLSYLQATENDFWIDDVDSPQYNQWVTGKPEAKSFEDMKRKDDLYKYGAVIEYNTNPIVPGNGSAIFIHIWRGLGQPTSGCVALSPRSLKKVLQWLDADRHPVVILDGN